MPKGVYVRTEAHRAAMRKPKGPMSEEHKRSIAAALAGRLPKNFDEFRQKGWDSPKPKGPDNAGWKGDQVGYFALHAWLKRERGRPSKCEQCGTKSAKRYEWANTSGRYLRDFSDWRRLCVSCHRKQDAGPAWNRGLRVQTNTGRTHIKPGQRISPRTEFRTGHPALQKRLTPRHCAQCSLVFQPREDSRKYCSRRCYWESMRK